MHAVVETISSADFEQNNGNITVNLYEDVLMHKGGLRPSTEA